MFINVLLSEGRPAGPNNGSHLLLINKIQHLRKVYRVLFFCNSWYWISIDVLPNGVGSGCCSQQGCCTNALLLPGTWLMNTFKQGNPIVQLNGL